MQCNNNKSFFKKSYAKTKVAVEIKFTLKLKLDVEIQRELKSKGGTNLKYKLQKN